MIHSFRLATELSRLFDLESDIDTALSESIKNLNQFMVSERSSIFLFQPLQDQLTIFSSLDLKKHDIKLPKSLGVAGWVFEHRKPALVNNAYEDSRFYNNSKRYTELVITNEARKKLLKQIMGSVGNVLD